MDSAGEVCIVWDKGINKGKRKHGIRAWLLCREAFFSSSPSIRLTKSTPRPICVKVFMVNTVTLAWLVWASTFVGHVVVKRSWCRGHLDEVTDTRGFQSHFIRPGFVAKILLQFHRTCSLIPVEVLPNHIPRPDSPVCPYQCHPPPQPSSRLLLEQHHKPDPQRDMY